jgi:hypothetical protein
LQHRALGTELVLAEARSRSDIETAFATFVQRGTGGLLVGPYVLFTGNGNRVLDLAARNKIPAMYGNSDYVRHGGLMSYSGSFEGALKVVVDYVGRILSEALSPPTYRSSDRPHSTLSSTLKPQRRLSAPIASSEMR